VVTKTRLACSIALFLAAVLSVSGQTVHTAPTSDGIISQMSEAQAANRVLFLPYTVTRDYKLFGSETTGLPKSHVIADISVIPPAFKKYTIENATGSGLAERIVRKALDSEVAFAKDSRTTDITRENYNFSLIGENLLNGQRCYVVEIIPKRKSTNLLRGTLWVDAVTHLPRRVEGEPAKNPSWWLTDVRVVLVYDYVGPMWVQTSSTATAKVRIIGRSSMIWHDMSYQIGDLTQRFSLARPVVPVGEVDAEDQR
jgi:hypothetical protein